MHGIRRRLKRGLDGLLPLGEAATFGGWLVVRIRWLLSKKGRVDAEECCSGWLAAMACDKNNLVESRSIRPGPSVFDSSDKVIHMENALTSHGGLCF